MNALLDTCVLSEYVRARPEVAVIRWLDAQAETSLFISDISLAELDKGIARLALKPAAHAADHQRVAKLSQWLGRLTERFAGRVLPVDAGVWRVWAQLSAGADLAGQPIAPMDGLLMATAQCHGLTVVTRNTADFTRYPHVFNPWSLAS